MLTPVTDPAIIEGYLRDASNTVGHASALYRPRSADDVAAVLSAAQARAIPVTVTARRTSTTGASVPQGGWLLSMEHLTAVEAPNIAQGGVILGQIQANLSRLGLLFPPDPTSRHECSLGASIACNASGARSFRYGPTRPWIEEIEVVIPTGQILHATRDTPVPADWPVPRWVQPDVKTAAGYAPADNLLDLMIGQEGTLGVITKARLRLLDQPKGVLCLFAFFVDRPTTLAFVERARAGAARRGAKASPGALSPRALEYFDSNALDLIRARLGGVPAAAQAALYIEVEHDAEPPLDAWWDALLDGDALADATIVAEDNAGRARLQALRHAVPVGVNERVVANGMPKIGTDFAVPDHALGEIMAAYDAVDIPKVCFGHIGDNHLHLNLLPDSPATLERARQTYLELARQAVALGGTVSAEHGIGKLKRQLLAEMVGPQTLAAFRALKTAVDPAWVLGRGNILVGPAGA
ncbi:MAG: FAD-binding oxidoreductase [Oligoflexia bacterium]|nr:FAD-binding oxidoreductase [Oligoflexia bacterium]